VGLAGVEPATSPLSGVRSNQLSYSPGEKMIVPAIKGQDQPTDRIRSELFIFLLVHLPQVSSALPLQQGR
jgi:hypothetical protein